MDLVYFENPLLVDAGSNMKEVLEPYISKTYLPVCQFDLHKSNIDDLQSILQRIIKTQSGADYRIVTPLSYLLGELIDNMNEHSQGKHGYIFSQYLKKEDCIDLVLADDGITVLGSYVKAQKFLDEINGNDAEALRLANEGKSTKNLPNAENRGYGISSSKEMLSDGLHGSFFMKPKPVNAFRITVLSIRSWSMAYSGVVSIIPIILFSETNNDAIVCANSIHLLASSGKSLSSFSPLVQVPSSFFEY